MKKVQSPNYTQMPNVLLDALPTLSDAELRVALVVCRQTFGFHRTEAIMCQKFLSKSTGMSARACSMAGDSLVAGGLLEKRIVDRKNCFRLVVENLPDDVAPCADEPRTAVTVNANGGNSKINPTANGGNTTKTHHTEGLNKPAKAGGVQNPSFRFVSLWSRDFIATFGRHYVRPEHDYASAKRLLTQLGQQPEDVMETVRLAWSKSGPKFWNCENKSKTVSDFVNNYNRIAAELGSEKPAATRYQNAGPGEF